MKRERRKGRCKGVVEAAEDLGRKEKERGRIWGGTGDFVNKADKVWAKKVLELRSSGHLGGLGVETLEGG